MADAGTGKDQTRTGLPCRHAAFPTWGHQSPNPALFQTPDPTGFGAVVGLRVLSGQDTVGPPGPTAGIPDEAAYSPRNRSS